jgi:hypothetical protein
MSSKPKTKEQRREYNKRYYYKHLEKNRAKAAQWRINNKARRAAYMALRRATDVNFRLAENLRNRLRMAIAGNAKRGSSVSELGCSIPELKIYLESKFQPGMNWENWGTRGWHIDHKKPLSAFDLTDPEQLKQAVHYTNLQPLWAEDNIKKRDL